ncbi:hypothetical protein [Thalassobacillus sp. CUG 92003]|uniref:hypothetical protein n=1 Tax=Thalassobacillus sp. CUG 92003 TaxID=2736641 RepID=UPI0015E69426|nr:hypothetical protein [Thalassobacillus sp. CUG 92003]
MTVGELAEDLKKEFKEAEKIEEDITNKWIRSDDYLFRYVCSRAFQYYEMGYFVSMIPQYIKCKQGTTEKFLRYCRDNYERVLQL